MPLYEYLCKECRTRHDIRHGFNEAAGACPSCGGPLERVFNVGGIHFKGSGFYSTDNKSGSSAPSAPAPQSESSSSTPKVSEKSA
ncbi:MAG TPA: FmdB family zinc ribbon protein [Candidatus Dormibacteraeota bacterium]|nr:FmdB family zinc ribbon protein [Candidatus Dormibacteraeota bacterium]